jgi:hypothetical protein
MLERRLIEQVRLFVLSDEGQTARRHFPLKGDAGVLLTCVSILISRRC